MDVETVGAHTMPSSRRSWSHARIAGCQHCRIVFARVAAFTVDGK
jgi:hypothetical protein